MVAITILGYPDGSLLEFPNKDISLSCRDTYVTSYPLYIQLMLPKYDVVCIVGILRIRVAIVGIMRRCRGTP